eukprot:5620811-Pleurochrysis_carterae.AAC.1
MQQTSIAMPSACRACISTYALHTRGKGAHACRSNKTCFICDSNLLDHLACGCRGIVYMVQAAAKALP